MRPPSRILRNVLKPSPRSPSRLVGRDAAAVEEQLAGAPTRGAPASPRAARPVKPGVSAGTMKALISGEPSSREPVRAVTMYVPAWPALVMKRLPPSMTQVAAVGAVLEAGGGPRAARVGAGARLGQAVGADHLALAIGTRKRSFCSARAGQVERAAAEARVGRDDEPERAPDPADLLDRDRVGERVEPGAALVLGERDAEPAELAERGGRSRSGSGARARAPRRPGATSSDHEVADRLAQELVLGGEVEVHGGEPSTGGGGAPGASRGSMPRRHRIDADEPPTSPPPPRGADPCPGGSNRARRRRRHPPLPESTASLHGHASRRPCPSPAPTRHGEGRRCSTLGAPWRKRQRPRSHGLPRRSAGRSSSPSARLGPTTPDGLAVDLGASRTGVLQQLRALEHGRARVAPRPSATGSAGRATCYDVTPDGAGRSSRSNYDGSRGRRCSTAHRGGRRRGAPRGGLRRRGAASGEEIRPPLRRRGCSTARRSPTGSGSWP